MNARPPLLAFFALAACAGPCLAADELSYTRTQDVVYGRKYGTALTLDVFRPKAGANGAGVIMVISGGFISSHDWIDPNYFHVLMDRGYTVFAVVHGSQPRFTIPEMLDDLNRAVRFVRHHAKDYGIDPNRIGITGASAGGHLSLMQGTAGDRGNPFASDPVDRESSRVQAVACYCPATDFLNFGKPGENAVGRGRLARFRSPFDFQELDKPRNTFVPVVDHAEILRIGRAISPVNHASADDPPTLIYHGDKDPVVPFQQSQSMIDKLKAAGVETRLLVKEGAGHSWPEMAKDMAAFADWFDVHLLDRQEKPGGNIK